MIQISKYEFKAEEGKVIVCKNTNQRFGFGIYLGIHDNIDNYFEDDATEIDIAIENGSYVSNTENENLIENINTEN